MCHGRDPSGRSNGRGWAPAETEENTVTGGDCTVNFFTTLVDLLATVRPSQGSGVHRVVGSRVVATDSLSSAGTIVPDKDGIWFYETTRVVTSSPSGEDRAGGLSAAHLHTAFHSTIREWD